MGKNRKAKQVVHHEIQSEDDGCYCRGNEEEVPLDFLTSDDFQVVQKKRHQPSKTSSDENNTVGEFCIQRSRSHSERFLDKEGIGCHAGFWTIKNHNATFASEQKDIKFHASKKKGALLKLKSEGDLSLRFRSEKALAVACFASSKTAPGHHGENVTSIEVKQVGQNENLEREKMVTNVKINVESFASSVEDGNTEINTEDKIQCETSVISNSMCLKQNCIERSYTSDLESSDKRAVVGDAKDSVILSNDEKTTTCVHSMSSASEGTMLKISSQKKKCKKTRNKQKAQRMDASGITRSSFQTSEPNKLVNSSSTDFSEMSNVERGEHDDESSKKNESGKRNRKRPSKKQLEAIHEALRKAREEEEKLKREEEAKQKQAEEAEKQALERLKLEQEKKEKKKLKEKQKRERLRAEGRLLSKSQKQSRARMEATLEVLRQQGIDVPQIGEKRPRGPRLGSYRDSHRKRLDSSRSDTSQVVKSERHKSESLSSQESFGKESLSDLPSSFDSKDSLDLCSVEGLILRTESDEVHFSCSDSDETHSSSAVSLSAKETLACKLKESISKSNLSTLKSDAIKITEEKKDCVKLRSPVVCVLGHVDTGKTKLLDYIRRTHVQDSEAGGITQQIGATMIPQGALKEKCKMSKDFLSFETKVPGLLVIDTPGHESFSNLRIRGSSICDIAILVVDIMHGLEPQTIESINLLKMGKIPFVVALNKIDRLYGWKSAKDQDIESTVKSQSHMTLMEFKKRCEEIVFQFANQCLNAAVFYENRDPRTFVSMVPTSAVTGDGMGNLLSLITRLTQTLMHKKLIFTQVLQATVLEVKVLSGLGMTIDVILVNGCLQEGDTIVLAGQEGPIVTQIRSLLMPQPLKEMRVKNPYIEYKSVEGAQGVKVTGKDLEKCIAGLPLYVAQNPSEVEHLKANISSLLEQTINCIKTSERGVYVQASTLGSLEALLEYLTSSNIPYFGVKVGPVVKKDVMKASIMLEHDIQYATILAFDVKVDKDAQDLADSLGVKVIHAKIIYHLCDEFLKHRNNVIKRRDEMRNLAVFPCILRLSNPPISHIDSKVLNVTIEAGSLRGGTPLCVPTKNNLELGIVCDIKVNDKLCICAKEGDNATVTMDREQAGASEFDEEDFVVSRITRQSVDICKEYFHDELDFSDWQLISELKKMLHAHV